MSALGDRLQDLLREIVERYTDDPAERSRLSFLASRAAEAGASTEREACIGVACDLVDDDDAVNLQDLATAIRARGGR